MCIDESGEVPEVVKSPLLRWHLCIIRLLECKLSEQFPPPSPPPPDGWLLGTKGYQLKTWLITHIMPTTVLCMLIKRKHTKARAVIERTFGLLRMRFRCLDRQPSEGHSILLGMLCFA